MNCFNFEILGYLNLFVPWDFSPFIFFLFIFFAVLFIRGQRKHHHYVSTFRKFLFWFGLITVFLCLQTKLDYYAERMFFIHRLQHLWLHHLGPLLIIGSFPSQIVLSGLPFKYRYLIYCFNKQYFIQWIYLFFTNAIIVPICFVFLIIIWLIPSVQFYSMLDWRLYRLMNWSVFLSGLMYWNLILDRRFGTSAFMNPILRVFSPLLTMIPQMIAGAVIAFVQDDLYPLFDLCGRSMPVSPQTDQMIGGLIIWIPSAFVEFVGFLIAFKTMLRISEKNIALV